MAETERITVAEVSEGPGGTGNPGTGVSLPVVELLTGRGFVTGKSGSGKSNSASVVAEKLLDSGFGLLVVDIDGEYYGLKEEYEILHAGADEECDIQITEEHAGKLATLALEQNVPIILDVSSFLDQEEAEAVLTAVARHLFAKAKKQKQPFLLLVEEVHEYIPENGSVGECGKMLIKIGKRGRKHGLGVVGISQRPADVKKDFITQCDWMVWHRLTWDNDTNVVRRVLDGEYAEAVEDLDDGEGFLMTDWSESVRRVKFQRKRTFDAGATPGLDDFERPDLKSVSDDLVSELQEISEEQQAREDRIAELREELDHKNSRMAELETELQDARDMSRMADQFVEALVRQVDGRSPGRTERERMRRRREVPKWGSGGASPADEDATAADRGDADELAAVAEAGPDGGTGETAATTDGTTGGGVSAADLLGRLSAVSEGPVPSWKRRKSGSEAGGSGAVSADATAEEADGEKDDHCAGSATPDGGDGTGGEERSGDGTGAAIIDADGTDAEYGFVPSEDDDTGASATPTPGDGEPVVVRELAADIAGLETKTRKMLAYYGEFGPATPLNAHFAAGGDGDRTNAYAHNRTLRTLGVVEHVGRGHYDYCLRDALREGLDDDADDETIDGNARDIEREALEGSYADG